MKLKIEPISQNCGGCGEKRVTTIPLIEKDWVGLIAPDCPCGNSGELSVQIPREDLEDFTELAA